MLGVTATARGLCMGGHFFLRHSPQEFRNGPWFHRCAHTLAVNVVDTAHKVRDGALTPAQGLQSVADARKAIDTNWKS